MKFTVPDGYPWILCCAVVIGFHLLITGFIAGSARSKVFDKAFFEKNFPELKDNIPDRGYPDMGSGKFAEKLSLDKWLSFNNGQRAHMNYLEGVVPIITFLLVSGLVYTRLAFLCGVAYIIGRQAYTIGYMSKGAKGRLVGVLILDTALVTSFIAALMATYHLGGGIDGIMSLAKGGKQA